MKANELMIFDLVRRKKDNRTMIVVEVGYDENIGAITTDDRYYGDYEDYHESEVGPILLTPEILEKNGFVRVERGEICTCYRWREKSDKIYGRLVDIHLYKEPIQGVFTLIEIETCSNKGDGLNRFHSCDTDYVHELQHALRICGIGKEIVL